MSSWSSIRNVLATSVLLLVVWLGTVPTAAAIQPHVEPEGYVAHQLAHAIFLLAMGYFVFRIRRDGKFSNRGWYFIALGAGLFAVWNVNTIVVHALTKRLDPSWFGVSALLSQQSVAIQTLSELGLYLGRMDSLLLVAAMTMVFLGVRSLRGGVVE